MPSLVRAQTSKPVTIVASFPAGGTLDTPARLVANALSVASGRNFIVENIAGAGGMIGAANVANAPPDGSRLLLTSSAQTIAQATYKKPLYDIVSGFEHIGMFGSWATALVGGPSATAKTLVDLVEQAKKNPGRLNIATPGNGTAPHLLVAILSQRAGIEVQHVPYKGAAPAIQDVLAGRVDYMATGLSALLPHVQAGNMTALAVAAPQRAPQLPEVPTFAEKFPGVELNVWLGLSAPKGLPAGEKARLEALLKHVSENATFRQNMSAAQLDLRYVDAATMTDMVRKELVTFRETALKAGLTIE
jgi:tripartite-type tricarboxylate transporter receptor subunit TctC